MEYSPFQMFLNSFLGVACAMTVVAKRIRTPAKHIVLFAAIFLFFFFANFWFLQAKYSLWEAVYRGGTIAALPFLLGFGWSYVLPSVEKKRSR